MITTSWSLDFCSTCLKLETQCEVATWSGDGGHSETYEVEFEIGYSASAGCAETRPTLNDPGSPAEGPEIEIEEIRGPDGIAISPADWAANGFDDKRLEEITNWIFQNPPDPPEPEYEP